MAQGERGGLGRARGGLEMAQDRNAPMALATSLEPWEKELQQAVNTCGAWRETQALVWLPARPPPPTHAAHERASAAHLQVLKRELGLAVKHFGVLVNVVHARILGDHVVHLDVGAAGATGGEGCAHKAMQRARAPPWGGLTHLCIRAPLTEPNILLLRRSRNMAGVCSGWLAPMTSGWPGTAGAPGLAAATSPLLAAAFFSTSACVSATPPTSGFRSGMTLRCGSEHVVSCRGQHKPRVQAAAAASSLGLAQLVPVLLHTPPDQRDADDSGNDGQARRCRAMRTPWRQAKRHGCCSWKRAATRPPPPVLTKDG